MTFQEAQTAFSNLCAGINAGMSSSELVQKQHALRALLNSLPNTPEFDPIVAAITEFSPKLAGNVSHAVVAALQSRDATFKETSNLLTGVSAEAEANAKTVSFQKPKLVLAALNQSIPTIKELTASAKAGDFATTAAKAEALLAMIENVRSTISEQ